MKYDRATSGNVEGIKAATGSIDKAKQKIYMVKPSMSRDIKKLCAEVGITESEFIKRAYECYIEKLFPNGRIGDI